jgi:SAM-dependent methyltransferase
MTDTIKVGVVNYEFTEDWFQYGVHLWPHLLAHLPKHAGGRRFMEIGSFEGRSAVWLADNALQPHDELVCIDTWAGGEEHGGINMGDVERRFDRNMALAMARVPGAKLTKVRDVSTWGIAKQMDWMGNPGSMFDFIYIDGSHQAPDVLCDAVMCWRVLRDGGVMVFDDYLWGDPHKPLHRPKVAIDAFMNIFAPEMVVLHLGVQIAIKKERIRAFD